MLEPTGITYDELVEKKAVDVVGKDYIPYKDGVFFTASKKAEFWVGAWKKEASTPSAATPAPRKTRATAMSWRRSTRSS